MERGMLGASTGQVTVAWELGKHTLDLMGVQEVRWEKGGTERTEGIFFYGEENMNIFSKGQVFS
jgi:hypothetical protein